MGISIFKELTAQRLYKSFGVKGLIFSTLMKMKFLLQHYKGKTVMRFLGNNGPVNSAHRYTVHTFYHLY
jgi:hypothetical protein